MQIPTGSLTFNYIIPFFMRRIALQINHYAAVDTYKGEHSCSTLNEGARKQYSSWRIWPAPSTRKKTESIQS